MSSSLKMQQQQNLELNTSLKMTVQMRQSIEMLLKNQFELREMILEEVAENPFLEVENWGDEQEELPADAGENIAGETSDNGDFTSSLKINDDSSDMSSILAEFDWEQIRETSSNNFGETNVKKSNDQPNDFSFENSVPVEESFAQSLDFQISVSSYSDELKNLMIYMAYNLDDKGFLADSDEDIAIQISADAGMVAEARKIIRNFEPLGCGCRNLPEYLKFVFIEHGTVDIPEMEKVTTEYIERLRELSESFSHVAEQAEHLENCSDEMERLSRNLTSINTIYELHLKSLGGQINNIDSVNAQTQRMADQIEELNAVYKRMLESMTVNMSGRNSNPDANS